MPPDAVENAAQTGCAPALSAVLVTGDDRAPGECALDSLLHQRCDAPIEVVVVDCARAGAPALRGAGDERVRTVRLDPGVGLGAARAEGARQARSGIVAYLDEHSVAMPGWASALVETHRGPWAAVGGEVLHLTSGVRFADAVYLAACAPWAPPADRGPADRLPVHVTSYKRDALLRYGDELPGLLLAEPLLQARLRRDGLRLFVEPGARTAHVYVSSAAALVSHFWWSCAFAARRRREERWTAWTRGMRVALAPLLPTLRVARLLAWVVRNRRSRLVTCLTSIPALLIAETAAVAGETLGALRTSRTAEERFSHRELRAVTPLVGAPAPPQVVGRDGSAATGGGPLLSVVLVVGRPRRRAAMALHSLLEQDLVDRMEVLLFDTAGADPPPLAGADHPSVRVIALPAGSPFAAARARGVREARAPVVAFLEEHAEVLSGWAAAVLRAHRGPWAGVGGEVHNLNSGIGWSNAIHLSSYLRWLPPARRGESDIVPGHNSSYRREALLAFGDELEELLQAEHVLQWRLRQAGQRLLVEPDVKFAHLNENTARGLAGFYHFGRCFAAARRRFGWSRWKRAAYVPLALLVPWLRLAQLTAGVLRDRRERLFSLVVGAPFIVLADYVQTAGQVMGLLFGRGDADRAFAEAELNNPHR